MTIATRNIMSGRTHIDERMAGASAGLVIATLAAIVGAAAGSPFLFVGIPAAGVAGWILGPRIEGGTTAAIGAAMGVVTVVIADALVVGGAAVSGLQSSSVSADILGYVGRGLAMWAIGLGIVGLPMLAITIPCGIAWVHVVRRVAGAMR